VVQTRRIDSVSVHGGRVEGREIGGRCYGLRGDAADCAYVIMEGAVDVLSDTDDGIVVATTLPANELFGELGVITNEARSATLRAKGTLQALRISDEMFLKLLADNADLALDVMRQLSLKLTRSHRQYEEASRELARFRAEG